jgi:hypothetical protein
MTKYKWSIEQVFYSLLALAVSFGFCHLALACFYSDSEIWLLTLSQRAFKPNDLTSIYYKWSFHALTYVFSHFSQSELDVYHSARIGWMCVALTSQAIIAYTFSLFAKNKKLFLPLFIAIMTFSAFFNQGFRIRGDILSLFAHAIILLTLFKLKDQTCSYKNYLWLFLWNIILLLSTPKSLYLYISQFVFAIALFKHGLATRSFFVFIWISHLAPVTGILWLTFVTHVFRMPIDLLAPIHEALDFYLKSFDIKLFNAAFFSIAAFEHVIKTAVKSIPHAIVFIIGTLLYFRSSYKRKKDGLISALNIYFGILFIFLVFHNQKLPFFIGTFGTPLIAYTLILYSQLLQNIFKTATKYAMILTVSVFTLFGFLDYNRNIRENNNYGQQVAIKIFDDYTNKHPNFKFYDIIGILPRKTSLFLFVGPGEVSRKKQIVNYLHLQSPDIILFTYKFIFLEPDIIDYLTKNFITMENNVWVKGDYFSIFKTKTYFSKQHSFNGKNYWLINQPPKLFVYDPVTKNNINRELLYFKDGLELKRPESANSFAVPASYLEFVQTNVAPIGFLQSPYKLFRFDTNY